MKDVIKFGILDRYFHSIGLANFFIYSDSFEYGDYRRINSHIFIFVCPIEFIRSRCAIKFSVYYIYVIFQDVVVERKEATFGGEVLRNRYGGSMGSLNVLEGAVHDV